MAKFRIDLVNREHTTASVEIEANTFEEAKQKYHDGDYDEEIELDEEMQQPDWCVDDEHNCPDCMSKNIKCVDGISLEDCDQVNKDFECKDCGSSFKKIYDMVYNRTEK